MSSSEAGYAIEALENLGAALKVVRISRGLSLRKCAAEIGISFSTVTRIESGETCDMDSALAVLRWLAKPPAGVVEVRRNPDLTELDDDTAIEPVVRVWECDQCGKRAPWGPGWSWYGTYRQLELTGEPELVVCSPACRQGSATQRQANMPEGGGGA